MGRLLVRPAGGPGRADVPAATPRSRPAGPPGLPRPARPGVRKDPGGRPRTRSCARSLGTWSGASSRTGRSRRSTRWRCRWWPRRSASPSAGGRTSRSTAPGASKRGRRARTGRATARTSTRYLERVFDEVSADPGTRRVQPRRPRDDRGAGADPDADARRREPDPRRRTRHRDRRSCPRAIWYLALHAEDRARLAADPASPPGRHRGAHPLPESVGADGTRRHPRGLGKLGVGRRR